MSAGLACRVTDPSDNFGVFRMAPMGKIQPRDVESRVDQLELVAEKARNHEPDPSYLNVMNLKMNFLADPRITRPPFAEALAKIKGS